MPSRPRIVIRACLGAALFVFPHIALMAESELEPLLVTASRIPDAEGASPPAVSIVTAEEIAARGATTVAEALEALPGLGLSDKGPEGSQVAPTIRGSTTNQVLVLVDGARANGALAGLVDLSGIPLDRVDHIEVMRGGASAIYGGDAVGGVVNIVTKKAAAPFRLSFENGGYVPSDRVAGFGLNKKEKSASASSLVDSQKLAFSWLPRLGDACLRLAGGGTSAANEYAFIDSNGERRERQNAALLAGDASIGADVPIGYGKLSADLSGCMSEKGVPGSGSAPTLEATQRDAEAKAVARYSADRFFSDLLSLDLGLRGEVSSIDYSDPEDPSGDTEHRLYSIGGDISQRAYLSDELTLAYGAEAGYDAAAADSLGDPERRTAAVFVEAALRLGAFSLRPSARYDYYSDFSPANPVGGLAGTLGASYEIAQGTALKLALSRSYRVPTFSDLYWPSAAGVEGNPELEPESAYEADLGLALEREGLRSVTTAYVRYSKDVILWQPAEDGVWRPSNFGAALYPGLEEELELDIPGGYSASVGYTFLHSYVLSGELGLGDDKRLPMTSEHELKGVLSFDSASLSWSATARYASLRYLKVANTAYLPAHFTLDVFLRWKASKALSAYFAADNLFGEQYAIVEDYPMPGTKLRTGVELSL
jgi:outer membrane cobalamin receptor